MLFETGVDGGDLDFIPMYQSSSVFVGSIDDSVVDGSIEKKS